MPWKNPNPLLAAGLVGTLLLASGCAANPETAAESEKLVKIYRTGSNVPVMVPYMGSEHLRYIEAQGNREAMGRMVDPPIPLRSN
jgi:hypothetical protein